MDKQAPFDWEYLGKCQFPAGSLYVLGPDLAVDCGEPAIAKVWWDDYDKSMLVCSEHFEFVKRTEQDERNARILPIGGDADDIWGGDDD